MTRVAVIGAGPSGLVTTKELLDEGHLPTCFDAAAGIGGLFRFDDCEGGIWESCELASSGILTAFSDHPIHIRGRLSTREYCDYLQSYCETFDLSPHIKLGHRVIDVRRCEDDTYTLKVQSPDGTVASESFDALAICSGLHREPAITDVSGLETFTGDTVHSSGYRRPQPYSGKRVLIVGGGESAAGIAGELAETASSLTLSLRGGNAVIPRDTLGQPSDFLTTRLHYMSPSWVLHTRQRRDRKKRWLFFAAMWLFFFPYQLLGVVDTVFTMLIRALRFPFAWIGPRQWRAATKQALKAERIERDLGRSSGGTIWEQFAVKSDGYLQLIASNQCRLTTELRCIDGRQVSFEDGSSEEFDSIIFCTGYQRSLPLLPKGLPDSPLYQAQFIPSVGTSLAVIGFARPAIGSVPPIAELQARWFALLLSGKRQLPSPAVMHDKALEFQRRRRDRYPASDIDWLIDYTDYCEAIAEEIGCRASRHDLRQFSHKMRWKFYLSPWCGAQYRLAGPHAHPDAAAEIIEALPIAHPPPQILHLLLIWLTSAILGRVLGTAMAPKLSVPRQRDRAQDLRPPASSYN